MVYLIGPVNDVECWCQLTFVTLFLVFTANPACANEMCHSIVCGDASSCSKRFHQISYLRGNFDSLFHQMTTSGIIALTIRSPSSECAIRLGSRRNGWPKAGQDRSEINMLPMCASCRTLFWVSDSGLERISGRRAISTDSGCWLSAGE